MDEQWAVPAAKKKGDRGVKRSDRPEAEPPAIPDVEDRLSKEPMDVAKLEEYLRGVGLLDGSLGVHEQLQSRDPMLIVLEAPQKRVMHSDGTESTVIDELLKSGDEAFRKSCGTRYSDFAMIQYTMKALLASNDIHAKKMMFLGMLAIDRGLHDQFLASYPQDGGPESARFEPFMTVVKKAMDGVLNTMYVNVPTPTRYNVDDLLRRFLLKCITRYEG